MHREFTMVIEKGEKYFIGHCPEVPGANGQGRTKPACLKNLAQAIQLILEDRRKDALRGLPRTAECELVAVE